MKRFLVFILGAFICLQSFAQVSLSGGYVNGTYRFAESGLSFTLPGNGFFVGLGYDIKSSNYPQVFLAPELNFNLINYRTSGVDYNEKVMSLPVHVKYLLPVSNLADVYFSAGPNLVVELEDWYFDVAFGFAGGVVLEDRVKLFCRYDIGVINQSGDDTLRATRNMFHLGIGYSF